jgi:hypothetical protein
MRRNGIRSPYTVRVQAVAMICQILCGGFSFRMDSEVGYS